MHLSYVLLSFTEKKTLLADLFLKEYNMCLYLQKVNLNQNNYETAYKLIAYYSDNNANRMLIW